MGGDRLGKRRETCPQEASAGRDQYPPDRRIRREDVDAGLEIDQHRADEGDACPENDKFRCLFLEVDQINDDHEKRLQVKQHGLDERAHEAKFDGRVLHDVGEPEKKGTNDEHPFLVGPEQGGNFSKFFRDR